MLVLFIFAYNYCILTVRPVKKRYIALQLTAIRFKPFQREQMLKQGRLKWKNAALKKIETQF